MSNAKLVAGLSTGILVLLAIIAVVIITIICMIYRKKKKEIKKEKEESIENDAEEGVNSNIDRSNVAEDIMESFGDNLVDKDKLGKLGYEEGSLVCEREGGYFGRNILYLRNRKGKVIPALVDTGATTTFITDEFMVDGIPYGYCNVRTVSDAVTMPIVRVPHGKMTLHDTYKHCHKLGDNFLVVKEDRGNMKNSQAVLGLNGFRGYDVICNHGNMSLNKAACMGEKCVPSNKKDTNRRILRLGKDGIKGHFFIYVVMKDRFGDDRYIPAMVDTGCNVPLICHKAILEEYDIDVDAYKDKKGQSFKLPNLHLADRDGKDGEKLECKNVKCYIEYDRFDNKHDPARNRTMLLGQGFLNNFKLQICADQNHGWIEVSPNTEVDLDVTYTKWLLEEKELGK